VRTFADAVTYAGKYFANLVAFVDGDVRTTYRELDERVHRLAGAMQALGIGAGERVAVLAENSSQFAELYLGLPSAGVVVAALNIRHTPTEIEHAIEDAAPQLILADSLGLAKLDSIAHGIDVVPLGAGYEQVLRDARPAPLRHDLDADHPAALFFTGGTTGRSKGVVLTHGNCTAVAAAMLVTMRLDADDRWLINGPMFHASGTYGLLGSCAAGVRQVIVPRFEAETALDTIERERITVMFGVPVMLTRMARSLSVRPRDVSSLRFVGHGGAPASSDEVRQIHDAFPGAELAAMYGTTETAGMCTALAHHERFIGAAAARSCGRPVFGVEVEIVDGAGTPQPTGTVGEVVVRGPNIMAGYLNLAVENATALAGDWYHTQDLGYLDADALLYLVDRKRDMIITGGENVFPAEVEAVLAGHPAVADVAVIGIPDERWGESVHAVVVARQELDPAELIAWSRDRIAHFKCPSSVSVTGQLPRNATGKVLKSVLREPHWAGNTSQVS
jgi:long-chain acyl-CoA synthetase